MEFLLPTGASAVSLPQFVIGQDKPRTDQTKKSRKAGAFDRSKINFACVGIGHMGSAAVAAARQENLVALCDVDWREEETIWGDRMPAQFVAENPHAKKFSDYREMLDQLGDIHAPEVIHSAVQGMNGQARGGTGRHLDALPEFVGRNAETHEIPVGDKNAIRKPRGKTRWVFPRG